MLVDLLAHGSLHVDAGIDGARRRRVGLAVGAERNDRELVLQRVHRFVVLGRAGAVDAPEDPDHSGGRLDLCHALRKRARPARTGDGVRLGLAARRGRACDLEHLRPAVQHRHDVVAIAHVGNAEDPGLLGDVEPDLGVERVGVGRGAAVVVDCGVSPHPDHLPHRRMLGVRRGHVGLLPADHVERDQRVAVDVGLGGDADRLYSSERWGFICADCERTCNHNRKAQTCNRPFDRFHHFPPLTNHSYGCVMANRPTTLILAGS